MGGNTRKFLVVLVCVAILLSAATTAFAFKPSAKTPLPDYDKRPSASAALPAEGVKAEKQLKERVKNAKVASDRVLGTPRWIWSTDENLSGPKGKGKAISDEAANAFPEGDKHRAVKAFIHEYRAMFGHGPDALDAADVVADYVDAESGLQTTIWHQQVDGIRVFAGVLKAHATKDGELVNIGSHFVGNPTAAADADTPGRKPSITAQDAVIVAAQEIGEPFSAEEISLASQPQGAAQKQSFTSPKLAREARAELVWLPMNKAHLRLCWQVVLAGKDRREQFMVLVDARKGDPLVRRTMTAFGGDYYSMYHVYTSDSPTAFSPGWSTPNSTQPPYVSRQWYATEDPDWVFTNETYGNYTDARDYNYARVPASGFCSYVEFDYPIDLSQSPNTYIQASTSQLFYRCNWLHDRYYGLGFNEASGNFQVNNKGLGGVGNDPLMAVSQVVWNNAYCWCELEGTGPMIELGVWQQDEFSPAADSALDSEIVTHEFTHAVNYRLVGGPTVPIGGFHTWGLSEGWADWYGLTMLSDPCSDNMNGNYGGCYAAAAYSAGPLGISSNYYWGIRRYPYSTDMTKNPQTFKDIDAEQADPHTGIPYNTWVWPEIEEVHNMGEIWCVTLWEARANLLKRLGASGNDVILRLVTEGQKLGPADPNYVEARDAILAADTALYGGAYHQELWEAFAKRGLGYSAVSNSSYYGPDVTEAYDLPPVTNTCAVPNFAQVGACYNYAPSVTITCATTGASIYYTTDGTDPSQSSTLYTGPVEIGQNTVLKAKAFKSGMNSSSTRIMTYNLINVVAPCQFTPAGGNYSTPQSVTITCPTYGATIRYTTNGTTPTETSPVYSSPIYVSQNTTVKAKAWKTGWSPSVVRTAVYGILVATPTFNPGAGTYATAQDVTLSCATSGATIRYTTNGTEPTESSAIYTGPIHIVWTTTIKAKAYKTGFTPSTTATAVYSFRYPINIRVKKDAPGPVFNGTTWNTAFRTIQEGINAAVPGDNVWIAAATYNERLIMKNGVKLYGGFAGTESYLTQRNWRVNRSIIDTQDTGVAITINSLRDATTRVDGLMITSTPWGFGQGIVCENSSPVIENNTITHNTRGFGGGIYCLSSSPTILNNDISFNVSDYGGGLYLEQCGGVISGNTINHNGSQSHAGAMEILNCSTLIENNTISGNDASFIGAIDCWGASGMVFNNNTVSGNYGSFGVMRISGNMQITNCRITDNICDGSGGGLLLESFTGIVDRCLISGNSATCDGGGIDLFSCSPTISNCVIEGNSAEWSGGGINCDHSSPLIINNTIVGNTAVSGGGGIHCYGTSSPTIKNNVVAWNDLFGISIYSGDSQPVLSYNNFYGNMGGDYVGVTPGVGSISVDPQFINSALGNYHLMPGSSCIDTGTNSGAPSADRDGAPRPYDGNGDGIAVSDMGAYEYGCSSLVATRNTCPNGTKVAFGPVAVTYALPPDGSCGDSWFYVQSLDRIAGIRLDMQGWLNQGDIVQVVGTIMTDTATGERYVVPDAGWPQSTGRSTTVQPLGMRNEWIGGGSTGLLPTIRDGFGFYNVGLLVHTWGRVTAVDPGGLYFYIDDGSDLRETNNSVTPGMRVWMPWATPVPAIGDFVKVTGISGTNVVNGQNVRCIRTRIDSIETVTSWDTTGIPLTTNAWNYLTLPGIPFDPRPEIVFSSCAGQPWIEISGALMRYWSRWQYWTTWDYCGYESFGACLLSDGYGLYIPPGGSTCYAYQRTPATTDQLISLPLGSENGTFFALVGIPFTTSVPCSSIMVTDGYSVLPLPAAVSQGWIKRVEYWNGSSWSQTPSLSGYSASPRTAYKVFPAKNGMALIVPKP